MDILHWFNGGPRRDAILERRHAEELLTSLVVMAWLVEAKDPYTGGHLWRVSRYAGLLAEAARLAPQEVARITLGGFLHDLGKIGIPDTILRKPDKLTDDEFDVIKTHPTVGHRVVMAHPLGQLVDSAIAGHHERLDGKGYPSGLKGDEIAIDARIIAICDTFDALTSARPYRAPMEKSRALDIITDAAGTQFDPLLVELLVSLDRDGKLDSIISHSFDGLPVHQCPSCGPLVTTLCDAQPGDHTYCPNCGQEFAVHGTVAAQTIVMTGQVGSAAQRCSTVDHQLITLAVRDVVEPLVLFSPGI